MLHLEWVNNIPLNQVRGNSQYPRSVENFQVWESEDNNLIRWVKWYNSWYYWLASLHLVWKTEDKVHDWTLGINENVNLSIWTVPVHTKEQDLSTTQLWEWRWKLKNLASLDWETDELIMSVLREIAQIWNDFIWTTHRDDGWIFWHSWSTTTKMKPFFRDRFTNSEVIMQAINKASTDMILAIRDKA